MAYSLQRAVSDGTLNTIPVSIKYFDKTDISVFVDDVLLPDGTYTYAWSANNIVITPNVAAGLEVLIKRTTKFDTPYHDFSAGAVFKDSTVDDNFLQMLFIAQETSEGATQTDFYADLNFHGYRLQKVGNAIEPDDAVPFSQYQADANGAFQQRILAESAKTAAQASQTAAASSASAAASSASAASTSATAAASSATSATNSASAAATSATNAANSASAASTSASAAAVSEANAASSAASINPADIVHKTGDETIGGIKTFSASPVLPGNATTALQAVPKQQLDSAIAGAPSVPAGAVMPFAMVSPPSGWLVANGAAVSRTTYSTLFSAIGTTFGSGDGLTTFNLPDLRGEFIRGVDSGRGVDVGRQLGSAQTDQNKSHTHTGTAASNGAHTHTTHGHNNNSYNNNATAGGGSEIAGGGTTGSAGAHTHTLTINADGGNEARPRNIALLYCIKA